MQELDDIYDKSGGDNIIYSWIEKAKDYLNEENTTDTKGSDCKEVNDSDGLLTNEGGKSMSPVCYHNL